MEARRERGPLAESWLVRLQEPPEGGQGSSHLEVAADTPQSSSLCQSNQSSRGPLPPGSLPPLVPGRLSSR